jgi:hypothetical protein
MPDEAPVTIADRFIVRVLAGVAKWCEAELKRYGRPLAWNTDSMWAWAIAAPAGFMLLIVILAWLEETIVFPVDRAAQISRLLEHSAPDEVEGLVARILAPVAPHRNAS